MSENEKLCECGCGRVVKPGNRFICGHTGGKTNGGRKYWEDLIMCYLYSEIFHDRYIIEVL